MSGTIGELEFLTGLSASRTRVALLRVKAEPDIEPDGLALRSLHHKLFDLGAFTVRPEGYVLAVSQHLTGSDRAKAVLLGLIGTHTFSDAACIRRGGLNAPA